jgi:RNA polymerase sigma factor (sigma-70 family)
VKRAAFLEHVGWTGGGIAFAITATGTFAAAAPGAGVTFVQISDSHIGFAQPANPDVAGTLSATVDRINALPQQPAFVMHTGDVTHLARADQFDTAKSILGRLKVPLMVIPGEHDAIGAEGAKRFLAVFPNADAPGGWWSFDRSGVHFVALVNVFNFETMGVLGTEQLDWLAKDLAAQKRDTPIVVFGHVPLYALYPAWGWTTEDGAKAIAMLRRFSAVTVLNGHIHQIITQRDGNIAFAHGRGHRISAAGARHGGGARTVDRTGAGIARPARLSQRRRERRRRERHGPVVAERVNGDRELGAAFAAHAGGALEEAYRRYGAVLQAAARHVLGNAADARDCVHDALVRVWAAPSAYRLERGALRTFLIVCVRNEAISRKRRAVRHVATEARAAAAAQPAFGVDVAERVAVRAALARLPREQRDVLELAYWGDYSQTEIAARLGIPLGTIKSRAALGLRKLARTLTPRDFA